MLPIKLQALSETGDKSEFDILMLYINQSMQYNNTKENDFVVSNVFKLSDDDLHREK